MTPRVRATSHTLAVVFVAVLVLSPTAASAQRHGHPGGGRGAVVIVPPPLYAGYGFYDPFWSWGYPGWGYPGRYGPSFAGFGSARLQVTPRQAEVYVDGYLAGTVDYFDGTFQRLSVAPGEHELTIYLEGYRTFTQKLLFRPGATINIKQPLEPLAPGEDSGPRPQVAAPPAGSPSDPGARRHRRRRPSARWPFACSPRAPRCSWTARSGRRRRATTGSRSSSPTVRTTSRSAKRA